MESHNIGKQNSVLSYSMQATRTIVLNFLKIYFGFLEDTSELLEDTLFYYLLICHFGPLYCLENVNSKKENRY